MKSEPQVFSIDHLRQKFNQTEPWDGVRNYQARNFILQMRRGDFAFFYHSNAKIPGIMGLMEIMTDPYPDAAAFDPSHKYFDPKSTHENPRWYRVDVKFKKKFNNLISLQALKMNPLLKSILLIRKGNRLSIIPLKHEEWDAILHMV